MLRRTLRKWLGIEELETELNELRGALDVGQASKMDETILELLEDPMTTKELAAKLGRSRSWASLKLNRLEKKLLVKESGYEGREIIYAKK